MKYYVISGIDKSRRPRLENQFIINNVDLSNVNWILYPNRDEITEELYNKIIIHGASLSCNIYTHNTQLKLGQISCSYKHYLALKDIVENNYEYAVIMEDAVEFLKPVNETLELYISELNTFYPDWDIIFDSDWCSYKESEVTPERTVYPKNIQINNNDHGGTRCAHFYLLTQKCAKKLYDNYIPFNNAPDWWMNDLFRKLNIKSFYAEPSIVHVYKHKSTAI
jgi:GR25 family glycosyltransferase involved in LPS biosynthesis